MLRAAGHISPHIKRSSTPNWNPVKKKKKTYFSSACDCCDERVSRRAGRQAAPATHEQTNECGLSCSSRSLNAPGPGWASHVTQKTAASVSVSLWLSPTPPLLAHAVRLMKLSEKPTPPRLPPRREAAGDGMRLSDSPLRRDALIPSLKRRCQSTAASVAALCYTKVPHPVPRTWLFIIFILDSIGSTLRDLFFLKCVTTSWQQCNYPSFRNVPVKNDPCDQGWRKEFNFAKLTDPELVFTGMCPEYSNCKTFTEKLCVLPEVSWKESDVHI